MSEVTTRQESSQRRSVPVRGGVAVVLSVLVNAVLVLVADALAVAPGFRAVSLPPVVFLSAVGGAGAAAVYWGLGRYVADGDRVFVRVAGAVLLVSFVPDLALLAADPAATVPGVALLVAMHVVVAAASVGALVDWGRQ
ncbi:hypothetical protein BRD00_01035 [Halobacteriales archaeon QS_8_69_26]|nr:MAG: hypothetical protein BRD00_01035 [Halobacteriales archaeon QS_8_69_26]